MELPLVATSEGLSVIKRKRDGLSCSNPWGHGIRRPVAHEKQVMRNKALISIMFALAAAGSPNGARADTSIQAFNTYLELPGACVLPAYRSLVDQIVFACDLDGSIASMSVYVEPPQKCISPLERSSNEIVLRKIVEARTQVIWRSKGFDHWFVWNEEVCVHAISKEVRHLQSFFGAIWQ